MSADNGVLIVEREPELYDVYLYSGSHEGDADGTKIAGNQNLRGAVNIAQRQETEYGISFRLYKAPRRWRFHELLNALHTNSAPDISEDNQGQIIIYTGFRTSEIDGSLVDFEASD